MRRIRPIVTGRRLLTVLTMIKWKSESFTTPYFDVTWHRATIGAFRFSIEEEHWDYQQPEGPPRCTVSYVDLKGQIKYLGSCASLEEAKARCEPKDEELHGSNQKEAEEG